MGLLPSVPTGEEHNRRWAVYEMPGYKDQPSGGAGKKGKKKGSGKKAARN